MSKPHPLQAPELLGELLAEIRDELRALRAVVERGTDAQPQDQAAGALVRCIAEQARAAAFSVAELLEHAQVVPELRAAIVKSVGALNGKKLGKLLGRIEGVNFDGVSIVRGGSSREGVSWLCDFQNRKAVAVR